MSEGARSETAFSQAHESAAAAPAAAADPLAAGEAIDEMLAANDGHRQACQKRKYPEPGFAVERSGSAGGRGSYTNGFKLKAAAFTRVRCADGNPVGNGGAAKVLGVAKKRVIEWVRQEEKLKVVVAPAPKRSRTKSLNVGAAASTADVDQALEDYINGQRKQHRGCGSAEVMNKLLALKPDALGGLPAHPTPKESEEFRAKFNNWYQRFRKRRGFSIRRRTSVGQKLPTGHEGMAWATVMKLRQALLKRAGEIYEKRNPSPPGESPIKGEDLTSEQLESVAEQVFEELGNMDQTPVQHEMPVETTLEKRGAKDARISTGGKEKERFTLCLAVMADGGKVPLRIIFKGTPFIPPTKSGKGKSTQPRKGSIAAEIAPANRTRNGHPARGISFGVQDKSWCDARECTLWLTESWKLRPNNGSIIKQRPSILVLDDFKCHKDEGFIADLLKRANTIVILIPGGLTPLLQPLDRMLNKQMKRLLRGMYTAHTATAVADTRTGKLKPPGRGQVSTWCKQSWAQITPELVKTCFKICGLTLALDGSEDHAWCSHTFGEGYPELLQQQRVEWEAQHPDVTLPPLHLPVVPEAAAAGTNPIAAAQKEVDAKLPPPTDDDSDVKLLEDDSDVEFLGGGGGGVEEEIEL